MQKVARNTTTCQNVSYMVGENPTNEVVDLPLENTQNFIGCHFFHTYLLPLIIQRHSSLEIAAGKGHF